MARRQIIAAGYDTVAQTSHSYLLSPAAVIPSAAAPTFSFWGTSTRGYRSGEPFVVTYSDGASSKIVRA